MKDEGKVVSQRLDPETYHFIFKTAVEIFEEISKKVKRFPKDKFYLTDQVVRHSRLVYTNLAEAWQMKDNRSVFIGKLSDAAQAASKTQNCLEVATKYNYIDRVSFQRLDAKYEDIFALICNRATIKSRNIS
jgi:four helix bundle protein